MFTRKVGFIYNFFFTFVGRCPHKFIIRYLRGITCNGYVINFIFSLDDYINSVKLGIILEEDKIKRSRCYLVFFYLKFIFLCGIPSVYCNLALTLKWERYMSIKYLRKMSLLDSEVMEK